MTELHATAVVGSEGSRRPGSRGRFCRMALFLGWCSVFDRGLQWSAPGRVAVARSVVRFAESSETLIDSDQASCGLMGNFYHTDRVYPIPLYVSGRPARRRLVLGRPRPRRARIQGEVERVERAHTKVVTVMREHGIDLANAKPQTLTDDSRGVRDPSHHHGLW